jgi:hypothetical protein
VLLPRQRSKLARGAKDKEHAMSQNLGSAVAVIGIDIGKNSFHVVELDRRGVIVLRCTEVSQQSVVMGHSRHFGRASGTSGLPPTSDMSLHRTK